MYITKDNDTPSPCIYHKQVVKEWGMRILNPSFFHAWLSIDKPRAYPVEASAAALSSDSLCSVLLMSQQCQALLFIYDLLISSHILFCKTTLNFKIQITKIDMNRCHINYGSFFFPFAHNPRFFIQTFLYTSHSFILQNCP